MHASPFSLRVKETIWEFTHYRLQGDANGHSLTQRLEFWKAAIYSIREHPFFGVGTGDMPEAFNQAYQKIDTTLEPEFRLRSHNQLLALLVAFGLTGGLLFLLVLVLLLRHPNAKGDLLFLSFWLIFVLSTITEDTLETQPGATFFALFISLFLFGRPSDQRVVNTSR
jgi:O-antigen ligase